VALKRRIGELGGKELLDGFWRICMASGVMGLVVIIAWTLLAPLCRRGGFILDASCLAAVILLGTAVYGCAAYLVRLPELDFFIDIGRRSLKRLLPEASA